jgi:hypothetical protein
MVYTSVGGEKSLIIRGKWPCRQDATVVIDPDAANNFFRMSFTQVTDL